jgi:hypothetical protein
MRPVALFLFLAFFVPFACRPQTPSTADEVRRISGEVIPKVEAAAHLKFREPPRLDVRTKAQVEQYLIERLDHEYPRERLGHIATAYRRFGLIPDTLDLRALFLAVLAEQVVGYFDPDSATLYVVEGAQALEIRLVLAHELVHALQHQYVPLDSLLSPDGPNDERLAAQAVLEGQATLASFAAMLDESQLRQLGNFWRDLRENVRQEQERMPVFAAAPLILREGLLFPYLAGADFVRWFEETLPDTQPYGPRLPRSTEQILHPEKYRMGDQPTAIRIVHSGPDAPLFEDNWGEFETRILLQELSGSESLGTAAALGWDGDWFALYPGPRGAEPIVWWSVWDSPEAAHRFAGTLERHWRTRAGAGRRWTVDRQDVGEMPGVRLVDAAENWAGWERLPGAVIGRQGR